jgi:thioredoxin reductase (NADPH)
VRSPVNLLPAEWTSARSCRSTSGDSATARPKTQQRRYMEDFEIIVVGAGAAGLTAGFWASRNGRSTVVLTGETIGGQLLSIGNIEDFPGFPEGIPGYELGPRLEEQATNAGAQLRSSVANGLQPLSDGRLRVSTPEGDLRAPAVIIATGSRFKALGVPGEERLRGRGVSHCATCDAPMLRGKTAGVVGGGDSALLEALELAEHAKEVILFHRGEFLDAQHAYQERARGNSAVVMRYQTIVDEIIGDNAVEGVMTRRTDTGETERVDVGAVFVYIGMEPQTIFLQDLLELDKTGRIVTDGSLRTTLRGVFAAGDARGGSEPQAAVAAGEGALAAVTAHRYLTNGGWG